jgi:hypothetical protein
MEYIQTKNPNFGIGIYFTVILYMYKFYGHLVHFVFIWYHFYRFVCFNKKSGKPSQWSFTPNDFTCQERIDFLMFRVGGRFVKWE